MEARRSRNACHCRRSRLAFSSTLLFLSMVLPTSSLAQLTTSLSPSSSSTPTALSASTTQSSTSSSNPPPTQTQPNPPPVTSTNSPSDGVGVHAFKYYFLIVAAFAVLFCICIVLFGRRKKRKAAMMRSQSQRALARDVEGWRTRFRAGLGNHDALPVEGLDERGDAPPPYAPGSKPPSIMMHDGRRSSDVGNGEAVELRGMSGVYNPPGYHEAASRTKEEDVGDITRPRAAVTASERLGSTRRLLSATGSSS